MELHRRVASSLGGALIGKCVCHSRAFWLLVLSILSICLNGLGAQASDPPPFVETPFEFTLKGIVVTVPTSKGSLRLLLDTGSTEVTLIPQATRNLHLSVHPAELDNSSTTGEEKLHFYAGEIPEIHLGTLTLAHVPFVTYDNQSVGQLDVWNRDHPQSTIDGLLGISALQNLAIGLDMRKRCIVFWKHGHLSVQVARRFLRPNAAPQAGSGLHTAPIPLNDGGIQVPVKIENVATSLTLDTGATVNFAGSRLVSYLHPITSNVEGHTERVYNVDAGSTYALCSLSLDGEVFPCPWFVSDDGLDQAINQKQTSGILSGFVFEGCRVIIDIPGHKLSFVRDTTAESAAREKLLRLGLVPVNTSEGLWARLGAETVKNAGMDRQDIVTQINHASLDHILDLKLLNTATTSLILTVMRSDGSVVGPKDVTVSLASLQKSALSSVPAGETFPLIPNEPVIYYFPYGALYVPADYKGVLDRTGTDAPLPTPTRGYLLPKRGPLDSASYARVRQNEQIATAAGALYNGRTGSLTKVIEIKPGECWMEMQVPTGKSNFVIVHAPTVLKQDVKSH